MKLNWEIEKVWRVKSSCSWPDLNSSASLRYYFVFEKKIPHFHPFTISQKVNLSCYQHLWRGEHRIPIGEVVQFTPA